MSYKFQAHDGGRSKTKYVNEQNDCSVVALSTVTGYGYNWAYQKLYSCGRKPHKAFDTSKFVTLNVPAYTISKHDFPVAKNSSFVTIESLALSWTKGKYVVSISGHVFAMISGVVYDELLRNPQTRVYRAWKFTKV